MGDTEQESSAAEMATQKQQKEAITEMIGNLLSSSDETVSALIQTKIIPIPPCITIKQAGEYKPPGKGGKDVADQVTCMIQRPGSRGPEFMGNICGGSADHLDHKIKNLATLNEHTLSMRVEIAFEPDRTTSVRAVTKKLGSELHKLDNALNGNVERHRAIFAKRQQALLGELQAVKRVAVNASAEVAILHHQGEKPQTFLDNIASMVKLMIDQGDTVATHEHQHIVITIEPEGTNEEYFVAHLSSMTITEARAAARLAHLHHTIGGKTTSDPTTVPEPTNAKLEALFHQQIAAQIQSSNYFYEDKDKQLKFRRLDRAAATFEQFLAPIITLTNQTLPLIRVRVLTHTAMRTMVETGLLKYSAGMDTDMSFGISLAGLQRGATLYETQGKSPDGVKLRTRPVITFRPLQGASALPQQVLLKRMIDINVVANQNTYKLEMNGAPIADIERYAKGLGGSEELFEKSVLRAATAMLVSISELRSTDDKPDFCREFIKAKLPTAIDQDFIQRILRTTSTDRAFSIFLDANRLNRLYMSSPEEVTTWLNKATEGVIDDNAEIYTIDDFLSMAELWRERHPDKSILIQTLVDEVTKRMFEDFATCFSMTVSNFAVFCWCVHNRRETLFTHFGYMQHYTRLFRIICTLTNTNCDTVYTSKRFNEITMRDAPVRKQLRRSITDAAVKAHLDILHHAHFPDSWKSENIRKTVDQAYVDAHKHNAHANPVFEEELEAQNMDDDEFNNIMTYTPDEFNNDGLDIDVMADVLSMVTYEDELDIAVKQSHLYASKSGTAQSEAEAAASAARGTEFEYPVLQYTTEEEQMITGSADEQHSRDPGCIFCPEGLEICGKPRVAYSYYCSEHKDAANVLDQHLKKMAGEQAHIKTFTISVMKDCRFNYLLSDNAINTHTMTATTTNVYNGSIMHYDQYGNLTTLFEELYEQHVKVSQGETFDDRDLKHRFGGIIVDYEEMYNAIKRQLLQMGEDPNKNWAEVAEKVKFIGGGHGFITVMNIGQRWGRTPFKHWEKTFEADEWKGEPDLPPALKMRKDAPYSSSPPLYDLNNTNVSDDAKIGAPHPRQQLISNRDVLMPTEAEYPGQQLFDKVIVLQVAWDMRRYKGTDVCNNKAIHNNNINERARAFDYSDYPGPPDITLVNCTMGHDHDSAMAVRFEDLDLRKPGSDEHYTVDDLREAFENLAVCKSICTNHQLNRLLKEYYRIRDMPQYNLNEEERERYHATLASARDRLCRAYITNTEMALMNFIGLMNKMGAGVILTASNDQLLSTWLRSSKILHAQVHPMVAEISTEQIYKTLPIGPKSKHLGEFFPVHQPLLIFCPIHEHDHQLVQSSGRSAPTGQTPEERAWTTGMLNAINITTYFGRLIIIRSNEDILIQEYAIPLRGDLLFWSWTKATAQASTATESHETYPNGNLRDRPYRVNKGQPLLTATANPKNQLRQIRTIYGGFAAEDTTEKWCDVTWPDALAKCDNKNYEDLVNDSDQIRKMPRWIATINSNGRPIHAMALQAVDIMNIAGRLVFREAHSSPKYDPITDYGAQVLIGKAYTSPGAFFPCLAGTTFFPRIPDYEKEIFLDISGYGKRKIRNIPQYTLQQDYVRRIRKAAATRLVHGVPFDPLLRVTMAINGQCFPTREIEEMAREEANTLGTKMPHMLIEGYNYKERYELITKLHANWASYRARGRGTKPGRLFDQWQRTHYPGLRQDWEDRLNSLPAQADQHDAPPSWAQMMHDEEEVPELEPVLAPVSPPPAHSTSPPQAESTSPKWPTPARPTSPQRWPTTARSTSPKWTSPSPGSTSGWGQKNWSSHYNRRTSVDSSLSNHSSTGNAYNNGNTYNQGHRDPARSELDRYSKKHSISRTNFGPGKHTISGQKKQGLKSDNRLRNVHTEVPAATTPAAMRKETEIVTERQRKTATSMLTRTPDYGPILAQLRNLAQLGTPEALQKKPVTDAEREFIEILVGRTKVHLKMNETNLGVFFETWLDPQLFGSDLPRFSKAVWADMDLSPQAINALTVLHDDLFTNVTKLKQWFNEFGEYIENCFFNNKIRQNKDFRELAEMVAEPTDIFDIINNLYLEVCKLQGECHFVSGNNYPSKSHK